MLLAAICTEASATLCGDDGTHVRYSFQWPKTPDDTPHDPDREHIPQFTADDGACLLESTLPRVEIKSRTTGERVRIRQTLDDVGSESLDPARMSAEEREALLSAEVQHDSQAVVDCVIRFGYWRDSRGRLHSHATWGLCAVLELPARQAYSRLPVTEGSEAPPALPCMPVDYGELSIFGSTPFDAINRALCHQKPAPKRTFAPVATYPDSSITATIQTIAAWLRDMSEALPLLERLASLESEVKARRLAAYIADPESYVDSL
jgi:hypothetical protein